MVEGVTLREPFGPRVKIETTTVDEKSALIAQLKQPKGHLSLLEIGFGHHPIYRDSSLGFGNSEHRYYLGIEYATKKQTPAALSIADLAHEQAWKEQQRFQYPDTITFASGDALSLPLTNDNVDVTVMSNLLLATGMTPETIKSVLQEQTRVLGTDGLIVVKETDMPDDPKKAREQLEKLAELLDETGFPTRALISSRDSQNFDELNKVFPTAELHPDIDGPTEYYLIVKKASSEEA
jgi:Methyltransferase domain